MRRERQLGYDDSKWKSGLWRLSALANRGSGRSRNSGPDDVIGRLPPGSAVNLTCLSSDRVRAWCCLSASTMGLCSI